MSDIAQFTGSYSWLSNFAAFRFSYQGITWPTAEHAFQAMKHPDPDIRRGMAMIATAKRAKQAGRRGPVRHDWESVKRRVMLEILLAKFSADPDLRFRLADTGKMTLIEGNDWGDTYWGCVRAETRPQLIMPLWGNGRAWAGQNWLGRCLMMTREVLS